MAEISYFGDDAIAAWNRRADGWQDIATAPKDGTLIDLWSPRLGRMVNCRWIRLRGSLHAEPDLEWTWWQSSEGGTSGMGPLSRQYPAEFRPDAQPTHWRPLPSPPRAQSAAVPSPLSQEETR
jgi:hypothetical protein